MDVREKLVELIEQSGACFECFPVCDYEQRQIEKIANHLIDHGVTVQEWIPQSELHWMGEEIAKLCIRYMEEYADFHGYASSKKVKAHIVRLLELEKDGRIAILPRHGMWEEMHYEGGILDGTNFDRCSVCGYERVFDDPALKTAFKYCPNCGAKMEGQ